MGRNDTGHVALASSQALSNALVSRRGVSSHKRRQFAHVGQEAWTAREVDEGAQAVARIFRRWYVLGGAVAGASVGDGDENAPLGVDHDVVEIEQVTIGTTDVTAVAAVEADRADLNRVLCDANGLEDRILVQGVQAVGDVEIVTHVRRGVVGVAVPWVSVDVRHAKGAGVLAAEVGDGHPAGVTGDDLWEDA